MTDNKADEVADILGQFGWEDPEYDVIEEQDQHFYVIGMDPGGTTGLAILRIDTTDPKKYPELIFLDQIPNSQYGFYEYFERFYLNPMNTVVASEVWIEHNVKGADRTPIRIEGVMHALWDDRNITWQGADQKQRVTDEWLVENNLWTPGRRHQMDALKHAIVWLLDQSHAGTASAVGGDPDNADGDGDGQGGGQPMNGDNDPSDVQGNGQPLDESARQELAELARKHAAEKEAEAETSGGKGEEAEGKTEDPKEARRKRELDGAFIGFESKEAEKAENVRNILDD